MAGLAAAVALATGGAAEAAGSGALGAGRREVALLAAGVAGLRLGLGALAREVTGLLDGSQRGNTRGEEDEPSLTATRVAGGDASVGAGLGDVAG